MLSTRRLLPVRHHRSADGHAWGGDLVSGAATNFFGGGGRHGDTGQFDACSDYQPGELKPTHPVTPHLLQCPLDASLKGIGKSKETKPQSKDSCTNGVVGHYQISPDLFRESFYALKRMAAPGIDGVTCHQNGVDLYALTPGTQRTNGTR